MDSICVFIQTRQEFKTHPTPALDRIIMTGTCWSEDLPPEIYTLIWRRLPLHHARPTFRAVCRAWRYMPTPLPMLCFNDDKFQSLDNDGEVPHRRFALADKHQRGLTKRCGCYDEWLLHSHHDWFAAGGPSLSCSLYNPLSGAIMEGMPLYSDDTRGLMNFPMHKVIVCSPELVVALMCRGAVAFCQPGAPLWSVNPSVEADGSQGWIRDIALYRGKVYAVDSNDDIFVHDLLGGGDDDNAGVPKTTRRAATRVVMAQHPAMINDPNNKAPRWMCYLVVCRGNLLLVRWSVPSNEGSPPSVAEDAAEGVELRVFEADLEKGRWMEVDDLGDHALFVGRGCSKAVRFTGDDQRFQGNRVYFLGCSLQETCSLPTCLGSPSYGFYDMRSRKISQIFLDGHSDVWPQQKMEWFFP